MKPMPTFTETEQATEKNIIRHNEDGTISVIPKGEIAEYADVNHDEESPEGWNDNLAEELSPQERIAIADELIEYYEIDEQVREEHFNRLTDGLRLMGLTDELREEFLYSQQAAYKQMQTRVPGLPAASGRWIGEMHEIAATFEAAGVTPKFHQGAAEVYTLLASTPLVAETRETMDTSRSLEEVVRVYARHLSKR